MANRSEAQAKTDEELDYPVLPPGQTIKHYQLRRPAQQDSPAKQWLLNYHGSIDSTALILAFEAGQLYERRQRGEA